MKAKPYKRVPGDYVECSVEECTHLLLMLPGPLPKRMLPVILKGSRDKHPGVVWSWNGDTEKPTVKPSISTRGGYKCEVKCHSWVNDGKVQFLNDCSHDLAGQTLDLLDI
ncbi:MAG: hypothetical protein KAS32_29185 [Candidatus Peribacteraceae bacterium]|nr:hypothetical protein [Candidatus Peribacteraceae bacterium]